MERIVFKDKNFVLTTISYQNEQPITDIITKSGGRVRSSAVKDTDYVVYGSKETTKYLKAMELKKKGRNIVFISEKEFIDWINSLVDGKK